MITKPINSFTSNSKFDWLKVYFTDKTALQFEIDGEVVGYLAWRLEQNNKVFHISKIEVCPTLHGKGYGKQLTQEVERLAKLLGCNFIDCWCENEVKLFYEKQGFKETGYEDFVNDKQIYKLIKKVDS